MAEGRTSDNNYLLQDYSTSIEYFDKVIIIIDKEYIPECFFFSWIYSV